MSIENLRKTIDECNLELIDLLNKRALVALEIGKYKKQKGLPILDEQREKQILLSVQKIASEKNSLINGDSMKNIFKVIMEETRKVEQ